MVKDKLKSEDDLHEDEKVLAFDQAKELTIAEAVKKHKELQMGITEDDGLLDRYIKQHREEIESQKFATLKTPPISEELVKQYEEKLVQESLFQETQQELNVDSVTTFEESSSTFEEPSLAFEETSLDSQKLDKEDELFLEPEAIAFDDYEEKGKSGKIFFLFTALVLAFVGVLATLFVWLNRQPTSETSQSTVSSTSKTTTTETSSSKVVQAFDERYAAFFTDDSLAKIKNSEFSKLSELADLLAQLNPSSEEYKVAKAKFEALEKAIQALQAINNQFDKPLIVDGELDTTATVKAGENPVAVVTGISGVDATITSAINFARSQSEQSSSTGAVATNSGGTGTSTVSSAVAISSGTSSPVSGSIFGISLPAGVTLQRQLSRVPYDQTKIDDVSNASWEFNPGILETIISVSQQRGYISGNQYILEKVNIINGNGYYNLFRPDGTYLFSLNCKTGYFVGNAAGHADALDY